MVSRELKWAQAGYVIVTIFVSGWLSFASGQQVPVRGNVVPIHIKEVGNQMFTSVTICEPGTQKCQTIPNIVVDTGSTGLRLFSNLVKIELPLIRDSKNRIEAECANFTSGSSIWGPIARADVRLGGELAANIPIHLNEPTFTVLPPKCRMPYESPDGAGFNGILGIQQTISDCSAEGKTCLDAVETDGYGYASCNGSECWEALNVSVDHQVMNPIAAFLQDNNGYSITFPPVPDSGAPEIRGDLNFGIGTRANNQPPVGTKSFSTDENGELNIVLNGKSHVGLIDSGTQGIQLPADLHLPTCNEIPTLLCPSAIVPFSVVIKGQDGKSQATYSFRIQNVGTLSSDFSVFNDVGVTAIGDERIVLGAPFFFGRSVFFGMPGKSSPLGHGPYVGATGL